jgi:hypothetical protein
VKVIEKHGGELHNETYEDTIKTRLDEEKAGLTFV